MVVAKNVNKPGGRVYSSNLWGKGYIINLQYTPAFCKLFQRYFSVFLPWSSIFQPHPLHCRMKLFAYLSVCLLLISCSRQSFRTLSKTEKTAIREARKNWATDKNHAHVLLMTTEGNMVVELSNETPLHRDNFMTKVKDGFYDSLLFHRVINRFMIQGGDPNSKNAKPGERLGGGAAPGDRIPAEFRTSAGLYHQRGALAMARTNNPEKASSNCQFYIVQRPAWRPAELDSTILQRKLTLNETQRNIYTSIGGTPHLDGEYTVFGQLLSGYDVLDRIAATATKNDRPETDIRMHLFLLNQGPKKHK